MGECCLLGICCPPEQRQANMTAHFVALGFDPERASAAASEALRMVDLVLALSPGRVAEIALKHKGKP